jgi:hypothetical protein
MEDMFKKLAIRLITLLIVLLALNFLYKKLFYEHDLQKHSDIINLVRAIPADADIVYLGESSNVTYRGDDLEKRSISAFLSDHYPDLGVYDMTKPAGHAGTFMALLENIPDESHLKTVVVTLNLRSFNAQWIYSNLETSLQKSLVLIRNSPPLYNRFLLSFKAYDIKTEKEREEQFKKKWEEDVFHFPYDFSHRDVTEWDRWMAYRGIKDELGNIDYAGTELACHYIKAYGFQIDTLQHPRIEDFNRIVSLAKERGWNLAFNLLAENSEKAEELVGKDLLFVMDENARILKTYFQSRGVLVIDNLNLVENEQFIDQKWTTEHYAEKGRRAIAENVASAIQIWHPGAFVELKNRVSYATEFFHDCEQDQIWGQMQTLTEDQAFSGTKSSGTGDGNNYSITFEYPLRAVPDSLKNVLNIRFKLYQEIQGADAKLVVEARGLDFEPYYQDINLKNQQREPGVWLDCHYSIPVPDSIKNAYQLKVYVFNPSQERIYIDDFGVNFEK